ncbi:MAG: nucleoside triphosphate pyrophosphohydrolase [Candidatus Aminicenantes bacterium 4484_214]|nr:MAG: nucleoside triphosphate pyrophosphohydrolase [Candidatus Aminicenantes bacterium 4484_214]
MKRNKTAEIGEKFVKLVKIIKRLREPGGCPWDRAQDENSLRKFFLEEAYEVLDALERGDEEALAEELGDMLMEIVFLARVFEEKGRFSLREALDRINAKMIHRHPHVFGQKRLTKPEEVVGEWVAIKRQENKDRSEYSFLEKVPRQAPALHTAYELGRRAAEVGFDWAGPEEVWSKVQEEMEELKRALTLQDKERVEEEIGDLLFSLTNLARHLEVNPEIALRRTNNKFRQRFSYLEEKLREKGKTPADASLEEMDNFWEESKKIIK